MVSPEDDIIDEDDDELKLIIDTEELKQNVKGYINLDELTLEDEDLGEIEELEIVDETQKDLE